MAAEIWILLIVVIGAASAAGGFVFGRRGVPTQSDLDELEQQLDTARNEAASVQNNVTEHFERSALLFGRLAHDYRDFLEHFSESAKELGISEIQARELLERADLPLLGDQREVIATASDVETASDSETALDIKTELEQTTSAESSSEGEPPLMEDVVPDDGSRDIAEQVAASSVVDVELDPFTVAINDAERKKHKTAD